MVFGRRATTPLEKKLGYRFRDPALLDRALTHRSFANERGLDRHYERLEFLGDAVLGLVAANWLFEQHPDQPEGELSKLKSSLVSARSLARHARRLGLGEALQLGVGEARSGGRTKRSLLADSMEAVFGAVYLDGGLDSAAKVVRSLLELNTGEDPGRHPGDPKTELQEAAQARGWALPEYRLVAEEGPDHQKIFRFDCLLEGEIRGRGEGRSKKVAEQAAAAQALASLDPSQGGA